jgi:hypothetical protein
MKRPERKNYLIGTYGEGRCIQQLSKYCSYLENKLKEAGIFELMSKVK